MSQRMDVALAPPEPGLSASTEGPHRIGDELRRVLANAWVIRIASLVAALLVWELVGSSQPYSLSDPTSIISAAGHDMSTQVLPAFKQTLSGFAVGFGISLVIGFPVGLLMGRSRLFELALRPYVAALYATPRLAIIPVLILWFGVTFQLRVMVVIVSGVFPIILNTYIGAKEVPRDQLDVGRAFAAGRLATLRTIVIPSSMHFVFAGIRIGIGRALIGIVVAEIEASAVGVGNLISTDAQSLHINSMWVPIILLGFFSIALSTISKLCERWITMPWSRPSRHEAR